MPDGFVQVPADGAGKKLMTSDMSTAGHRQQVVVSDPTTAAAEAAVAAADPAGTEYALLTRPMPPALAKGTQGTTGFTTQDLKDAGRVSILWTVNGTAAVATTEGLLTVSESRDGATVTTFTTKVITSGKRLRITSLSGSAELTTNTTTTAISRNRVRIRHTGGGGAVTTSSPLQWVIEAPSLTGSPKAAATFAATFPDGIEFLGNGSRQIGFTWESPDWVTAAAVSTLFLSIYAYEY